MKVASVLMAVAVAGSVGLVRADAAAEERTAQVKLMGSAALLRLADDWANAPGAEAKDVAALRQFAAEVEGAKQSALDALRRGDGGPAAALVARQRRLMAAHPLLRGLEVLAVKHAAPGNPGAARRDGNPAQPGLSCYNHLDVWKWRRAGLVAYSGFDAENPVERKIVDHGGTIHAVDLEFDGSRILYVGPDRANSNKWRLFETDVKGSLPKTLLPTNFIHEAADCCWLPDGRIVFTSDAGEQGLPCETGRVRMSNSYRLDPRSGVVERLTYDQDSNWYPSVLNDGRVLYVRWEYCDLPHFFSRVLMTMNPDGTRQMGFYGSNDYWPNHFGSPLAIPGDNGKFVCVATGHHTSKAGRLVLFDAERASAGPAGAVQMIPGWGQKPEGVVMDTLYGGHYPRFLQPFPLGSCPADGAGKFFLAAMKASPNSLWGIYLVDVFDNITLLAEVEGWCLNEPIAIRVRKRPPAIPDKRRVNVPYATVYCGDLYQGEGLKGVPKGTVKEARIFAYHYAFNKSGGHEAVGLESSWDIKYVLGTVPVTEDGGILFEAPVNTPISIQPLDENGCALQLMRSWTVGMPGEYVSCVGCHEKPSVAARPLKMVMRAPSKIKPPEGRAKPRTWSFLREIQPILQRRCSGCHNQDADPLVAQRKPDYQGVKVFASKEHGPFLRGDKPNLADITPIALQCKSGGGSRQGGVDVVADDKDTDWSGAWAKSYVELVAYVRRPGPESDYRLFNPMEYHANTSPLVQILKAGHHGVKLTDEEWRRIYTWIDLNAPFWGTWKDTSEWFRKRGDRGWAGSGRNHNEQLKLLEASHQRRQYGESRFQGFWDPKNDPELDRYGFEQAKKDLALIKFEPPEQGKEGKEIGKRKEEIGKRKEEVAGYGDRREIDAPGGKLAFRKVEDNLWICESELPLANYLAFKPDHYNGVIDWVGKDHQNEGERVLRDDQSVIRVSFDEAKAYAKWLSEKTGCKLRLPTEAEWERAARAGRTGDYAWDGDMAGFAKVANLSDVSVGRLPNQFNVMNPHLRFEGANDGEMIVGSAVKHRYQPNAAGLYDMIGNVEEWCMGPNGEAIARGAAFNVLPRLATYGRRNRYLNWQRVFNVGIRLAMETPTVPCSTAAAASPFVWPEVTTTMKPWAINWWMGSAVDEAGLEYQCAEMERAHFGGFNVVHVYNDFKGNARKAGKTPFVPDEKCRTFMSDEWLEAWNLGVRIARSHHLDVDLSMCGGWCFGGPWVTEDDAATSKIPIHIPGPGGDGFHIDPFSPTAMRHHLDRFEEAFGKNGIAERPRGFYHDSFEYYGAKPKQGGDIDEAELACFKVWTDWCRENGYETRQQAHGSPANWLDLYAQASIPETEMFGRKDKNRDILLSKFASSAAHIAGRKLVSAEACTWVDEHFQERPKDVKMMLDQMFLAGINHIFYHGCSYSPATAPWPGWCFFASLQMNPRNPLWREVRTLNDYVIRCQSIFQTWKPDNDLLVRWDPDEYRKAKPGRYGRFMTIHNGHEWFNPTPTGKRARALWADGYQFDFVSDRQLAENPQLKERLDVARAKPSPFTKATGLLSTRWTKDGATLYFVVNHSGSARVLTGDFTLMDPMTGRIGRTSRHVLHPYASVFVSGKVASEVLKASPKKLPLAAAAWRVTPVAGGPVLPAATNLTQLVSWSAWDESFAGTMRYETTFDAPAEVAAGWSIDLGGVREAAHVWLNGQDLGAYLIPPYRCRIPGGLLQAKGNSLVVEATSLGANRIRHIYRTNGKWKEFADMNFYNYDYHRFDATNWRVFPCGLTSSLQFVEPETAEIVWQARPKTIENASWIWANGDAKMRAPAGIAHFRRTFAVDAKPIVRAQVLFTADNKAEVWLNGARVGATDPVRESWRHACKFDVTAQVKTGANVLAVKGENLADAGATNPAGLVLALETAFADGTRQLLVTDGAWSATTGPVPADWMQPSFDASAWKPVPFALPFDKGLWFGRVWW